MNDLGALLELGLHSDVDCIAIVRGKSNRSREPKTRVDNIKEDLKERNIDTKVAREMSRNREKWSIMLVQPRSPSV